MPDRCPRHRKAITEFSFNELTTPVVTEIDGTFIAITLPDGTVATELIATFELIGLAVIIEEVEQVSGITVNDFSNPVR